jgi:hypothetical protein
MYVHNVWQNKDSPTVRIAVGDGPVARAVAFSSRLVPQSGQVGLGMSRAGSLRVAAVQVLPLSTFVRLRIGVGGQFYKARFCHQVRDGRKTNPKVGIFFSCNAKLNNILQLYYLPCRGVIWSLGSPLHSSNMNI